MKNKMEKNKQDNNLITIIVIIVGLFLILSAGTTMMGLGGMMGCGGYGFGSLWLFGWLFMILIVIALVLFIVWLIKEIQKK